MERPLFSLALAGALVLLSLPPGPAVADDALPPARPMPVKPLVPGVILDYDPSQFTQAQTDGKRILLVFANRFSTVSQDRQPVLERLARDYQYPDVVFFTVDAVRRPDLLRQFRATEDSVVVYRGIQERGRSGDTGEMELRHLLDAAR